MRLKLLCSLLILGGLLALEPSAAQEPPLPAGLGESKSEPALPAGLGASNSEPALPSGLGGSSEPDLPSGLGDDHFDDVDDFDTLPKSSTSSSRLFKSIDHSGFTELRVGSRTQKDPHEDDFSIGELRLQNQFEWTKRKYASRITADLVVDPVADDFEVGLETGRGFLDLREAYFLARPSSLVDLKIGRQILTWGLGDLVFLNDMFPKDWNSFFIGRDTEYLKAPSDALKVSVFSEAVNIDLAYTPRFDTDRYIDGTRISYFNSQLGRRAGQDAIVDAERPDQWFEDHEFAARLYRRLGSAEVAAYFYHGFWKSPNGFNPATGQAAFPKLNVWGASALKPLGGGIASLEFAFYDTIKDRTGSDPFQRNGELRFLAAFEREIVKNLTGSVQYYIEHMLDHQEHAAALPQGSYIKDESRHLMTLRLTKSAMNQNLTLSLFAFYSPTDEDAYLRPNINYSIDDSWTVDAGANVFFGSEKASFFAQFERNSNLYAGLRYSF